MTKYATASGVDPELAMHILAKENGAGDPKASNRNSDGSVDTGLMQVNSIHGYTVQQLQDPETNIRVGVGVLAGALKAHRGNLAAGIAAYNGSGPKARAYAADVLTRYKGTGSPQAPIFKRYPPPSANLHSAPRSTPAAPGKAAVMQQFGLTPADPEDREP